MTISSKRAEYLARAALALSVVSFIIALLVGLWSRVFGVYAVSWLIFASVLVWFVLCLQFHLRSLAEQEKLDAIQLARDRQGSTIFQGGQEGTDILVTAQRRLELFEKWFVPVFSGVIAVYGMGIGLYLWTVLRAAADEPREPLLCAVFMAATAFLSFLISRYATGMSSQPQWKPLRAGGSYLLGAALLCFALSISLALYQYKIDAVLAVVNRIIPVVLAVLGAETGLNVILDIYRPRIKGQYSRSAFDSRLLGLINEPGGIFRTAASAIDYQFGFKVSQTWFYKLLEKAIVPLILFAAVTFYLMSCLVVVGPNEEAIVEHFGNPFKANNVVRHVGPGFTFKWPWPIDIVYKYPTKEITEISVGFVPKSDSESNQMEPLLWGTAHYQQEHKLLVAGESSGPESGAVPVSLVIAAVPVQYRVKDLYSFLYNYGVWKDSDGQVVYEAHERLKGICYSQLTEFAASARIEVGQDGQANSSLLGAGRTQAKEVLTKNIQAEADKAQLGVEIVFVGLQGIHPPPEVAEDYQKVIGAVQIKRAKILAAEAVRNMKLSLLAGSVDEADRLYDLAGRYQRVKDLNDASKVESLGMQLDHAFASAKGEIFKDLRESQSYSFERVTLARATGEQFAGQVKAYNAAPEYYKRERRLAALEEGLADVRKYVVVADANNRQITILNLEEKQTLSLYDITGTEENSKK